MAEIAEPLRPMRVLSDQKKFVPLKAFSCGRQGNRWERAVNNWVKRVARGDTADETVLVLEDDHHRLIGLCSIKPQPYLLVDVFVGKDAREIHMLATDRLYRGVRLKDGSRPGDVLLAGALEQIKRESGGSLPCVSAVVAPDNDRSHALFDRHGFGWMPYVGEGEITRALAPRKRLSLVRLKLLRELSQHPTRAAGT